MLGNHGRSITRTIFTPLARLLAKAHVTPDQVTIAGTLITVVLAVTLLGRGLLWQGGVALGVVLFCDSVDGVLARLTGQESRFGAFLDSTMDRLGDGAVFGSLLAWVALGMPTDTPWRTFTLVAGIVAMVGVGAVPYARARAESVGVVAKVGIAERTDRLIVILVSGALTQWTGFNVLVIGFGWVAFASLVTVAQRVVFTARALRGGEHD